MVVLHSVQSADVACTLVNIYCFMECCTAGREAYICKFWLYVSADLNETSDAKTLNVIPITNRVKRLVSG